MFVVPEQVNPVFGFPLSIRNFCFEQVTKMNNLTEPFETKVSFSHLLELAAHDDVERFKQYIESYPYAVDEVGLWYGRQVGGRGTVLEYRTPLMVAAMYGSLNLIKLILSCSKADVNRSCGHDKSTALHCAASGGSMAAIDAVKLLIAEGADPTLVDAKGNRPLDVINVSRSLSHLRVALEGLLSYQGSGLKDSQVYPVALKSTDMDGLPMSEKKEYPVDPTLPDINNSIYATDEFRMFSFKVRPCSRAYSHDWTECPFVHPGENARRRDPRKYHYSCVTCPDFRKGSCKRGDMCEYAHGVFECWLHPAQYRTRLCKDGTSCGRRVCFFAHTPEELRPLYASTGSAVPSPRSMASAATIMDMAAALNSPSATSAMSSSPFTPPMSPSGNGMSHSSPAWQQPNIPTLHLPGSNIPTNNLQTSRLRSSLNAQELEQWHILNDMSFSGNLSARSKSLAPSNLDDLFSAEISSVFSPSHKSVMMNHFQHQQSMPSPINTKAFSPQPVDHPLMQASFGPSSPGIMSPRVIEPQSPLRARLSALTLLGKQQHMRSLSAGMVGSPVGLWSSNGRPDWSVNGVESNRLNRSSTIGHNSQEPDLSWVQSLVKDSPSAE